MLLQNKSFHTAALAASRGSVKVECINVGKRVYYEFALHEVRIIFVTSSKKCLMVNWSDKISEFGDKVKWLW